MFATLFFVLDAIFIWLLFEGYSTQKIMARGWGIQPRIYERDSEPIMFWVTFWTYLIIVVVCTVIGILLAFNIIA